jgi:hypothetical protein
MATGGLYGSTASVTSGSSSTSETVGLYGNTTQFGGSYFEWFIFQEAVTQPATPTGGSWDFTTNTGTAPTGWTQSPPSNPTYSVWVSIALVNSKTPTTVTWSTPGLMGTIATTSVGTTTTGAPGTSASVVNAGTGQNAILNFTIPQGATGATGPTGPQGPQGIPGTAATVSVGTTTTGAAGSSASVSNSGTSSAAVFNFTIPRGDTGATGPQGSAATIAAGTTTTSAPGTNASVVNSGTSSNAVFDFTIPRGAGVLAGGTTGQFLAKASNSDFDTQWLSITGGLSYLGSWNASTNTPTLTSSVGVTGGYYVVSVAGTTNLNGITDWQVGDWAIFNGSFWQKIDQTNTVTSVNGQVGAVNLTYTDVNAIGSITSTDGSVSVSTVSGVSNLSVATAASTTNVLCQVRNTTGATLTKGTVVYITGATGQIPTVSKALANADSTSAQTLGLMTADLANNSNGYVTIIGLITNMDTSAYTDGQQLYLSGTVAGGLTSTKPSAPTHLVYVAVVEYAHPTQGKLFVKVQNGYELDELHDVQIGTKANGQTIIYNASTGLWQNNTLTAGTGVSITNGAGSITVNNTGVTSVGMTVPTGLSVSGSPVTTTGTFSVTYASGYSIPTNIKQSNWDDAYTFVGNFPTQTGNAGKYLTTDGSALSWATVASSMTNAYAYAWFLK